MNHGSLFSGIGGFDLAAQWMGWNNVFHCEINPFGQKILKHYWPNADSYEDIKTTDFTIYRGTIDVLSGGFPCQPFSLAGKRKGAEDDRYLWPEMLRAIDEIRPRWVIGENVAGLVSMVQPEIDETDMESQTNLQGEIDSKTVQEYQQYVVETVCRDLENFGYSVQPIIIPACAVGAPHRRDRIWFVAYASGCRFERQREKFEVENWESESGTAGKLERRSEGLCIQRNATDTESAGFQGRIFKGIKGFKEKDESFSRTRFNGISKQNWTNFPTQPAVCGRDDGLPTGLDGITFPKWRAESIKGYGNAIVPQVAYEIFKGIEEIELNR
ncbi:DNA cytosine methyltransferase [Sphingobacterium deserti]|uniref:Cytosine-specific methyltransferase n=1 Tax=Sphingobacterium deserti TaxID=1229276 RepID=A0A0B8T9A5_9SPHI|nr:DNA (cytosine-5-)-methyltransferase [Sphingobacterium deserti]KGE14595.1 site-specific DNA-methyltransferase [Sphingobacterium deserti]